MLSFFQIEENRPKLCGMTILVDILPEKQNLIDRTVIEIFIFRQTYRFLFTELFLELSQLIYMIFIYKFDFYEILNNERVAATLINHFISSDKK